MLFTLTVAYLLESAFELRNTCTGYGVHVAAVAALQEMIGNTCDHCSVISAKLKWRENAVEILSFCKHCAKTGVCSYTAATDNCFETGVVCGFKQFSNQRFNCSFLEGGTHVFC